MGEISYFDKMWFNQAVLEKATREGNRNKLDFIKEIIIKDKREYRQYTKKRGDLFYDPCSPDPTGVITASHWDYDGGWMKVLFEGQHWTEEEKRAFIGRNWKHYKPSQYDCTGQIFTWYIGVFNVPKGVVAYIKESIDV